MLPSYLKKYRLGACADSVPRREHCVHAAAFSLFRILGSLSEVDFDGVSMRTAFDHFYQST